jgi:hypothetical protein
MNRLRRLAGQFLQEFLFIQAILEGLSTVDEHNRDLVRELALELIVGFNVHFAPAKSTPPLQFRELFFDDFAKVAPLPGIHDDFAQDGHRAESSKPENSFPAKVLFTRPQMPKRVNPARTIFLQVKDGTIRPWQVRGLYREKLH